jgi:hypothetical protein
MDIFASICQQHESDPYHYYPVYRQPCGAATVGMVWINISDIMKAIPGTIGWPSLL